MYKKMAGVIFTLLIVFFFSGCGDSRVDPIKDGYLKAFGTEVTIGEVFDVVAEGGVDWEAQELASSEAEASTHYLVEAKWDGSGGEIAIQFLVKNDGSDFRLHGSKIGGSFQNAIITILAIKKAYNQKNQ